jgi:hypothetical protein
VAYGNSEDSGRVVAALCKQLEAHVQLGGPVYAYGDYSQPSLGGAKAFELIQRLDWQPASSPGLSIRQARSLSVPQACLLAHTNSELDTH